MCVARHSTEKGLKKSYAVIDRYPIMKSLAHLHHWITWYTLYHLRYISRASHSLLYYQRAWCMASEKRNKKASQAIFYLLEIAETLESVEICNCSYFAVSDTLRWRECGVYPHQLQGSTHDLWVYEYHACMMRIKQLDTGLCGLWQSFVPPNDGIWALWIQF